MVKKKRSKRDVTQESEAKMTLINKKELIQREQKQLQRLRDVGVSKNFIEVASQENDQLREEQERIDKWNRYLSCDGLPKPNSPQDIRKFMVRMRFFESTDSDDNINWTLAVNERSILSQDIFRKDLTRETLKRDLCPNIGAFYDKEISSYLATIDLIEHLMDNEIELSKLEFSRSKEIVALKTELEAEIADAFDRYTYRIISAMDAFMTSIDGIETNYSYKGMDFDIHIWALRYVPIRFEEMLVPSMIANMDCVGVQVQIPLSCLFHHLTLRCVHSFFDNFTPNAKTYQQIVMRATDNLIAGITDIEEALISEWLMQIDLMDEVRRKMVDSRANYEQNKIDFETKVASASKRSKSPTEEKQKETKQKIPKPPKEVPLIEDDMFPDVQKVFFEKEKKEIEEFLYGVYHPDIMNLNPGEINLKKYIMLGGTYNLCYVEGPKSTEFGPFSITNHGEGRKLNVLKDIVADLHFEHKLFERRSTMKSQSEDVKRESSAIEFSESPYFVVTFELPKHLCMWGVPIVCQYEECEVEDTKNTRELASEMLLHFQNKAASYFRKSTTKQTKESDDENVDETEQVTHRDTTISIDEEHYDPRKKCLKRLSEIRATRATSNIYRSRLSVILRYADLPQKQLTQQELTNFNLKRDFLNMQAKNLQRYCMPRIISSFKFPMEINEEAHDMAARQAQPAKSTLFRHRAADNEEVDSAENVYDADFNYEQQTNPERVFPVFQNSKYANYTIEECDPDEPDTICHLLNKFDDIRTQYTQNSKKILDQKSVKTDRKFDRKQSTTTIDHTVPPSRQQSQGRLSEAKRSSKRKLNTSGGKQVSYVKEKTNTTGQKQKQKTEKRDTSSLHEGTTQSNVSMIPKLNMNKFMPIELLDTDQMSVKSKFVGSAGTSIFSMETEAKPKDKGYHWTSEHIVSSTLNPVNLSITVQTDRLGIFGFAYNRYEHFPFRNWCLEPHPEIPNEIIFTLDTFHVRVVLYISKEGYTGYVTDLTKSFVSKPVKYLTIETPITEFKELKKRFLKMNVNIFAEQDACFYIDKGYFSVKHLSTESHVYETMALHCFLLKFYHSSWNRLATRRNIVIDFRDPKEKDDVFAVTVRITPEDATFVEIKEQCSNNLDEFILNYKPTWRNINQYTDLHYLINSMYPAATDNCNRDPKLLSYLCTLFNELRPLSYS